MVLLTADRVTVNRAREGFYSFKLAITFFVTGQATRKEARLFEIFRWRALKARQVEGVKVSSE